MSSFTLPEGITLVQTREGTPTEYRGIKTHRTKTVVIDRKWEVRRGDEVLGTVEYKMVRHEQKTPGNRYVNKRWNVPAWVCTGKSGRSFEVWSKTQCIKDILHDHGISA